MIALVFASATLSLANAGAAILAVGALGTAAFGLVDALKAVPGVNNNGFHKIKGAVTALAPLATTQGVAANSLSQEKIIATLKANWGNGVDLGNQKSIAKSLLKLHLNPSNAASIASAAGVDPEVLQTVAAKIVSGTAMASAESDVYARFDLIVTAMLDQVYQDADCAFRHRMQVFAMIMAVALAVVGDVLWHGGLHQVGKLEFLEAVGVGLIATPLAPVAKDLATALQTAVNAMQAVRKV